MLLNNNQREAIFGQEGWRFPVAMGSFPSFRRCRGCTWR